MPTETANWVGQSLSGGRYQVTGKLGEGGMAFVFRAVDRNLGCEVVVKVPRPALLQEPEFTDRFAREVRSLVRLAHPHIVKLIDVGTHDGIPFAVMQYLPGGSLRDRQEPGRDGTARPRPPEELRGWLADVAAALDFMHQEGYLHRDVKPDNILFDGRANVYLSDFGIAKALAVGEANPAHKTVLTSAGVVLGTAPYMAPEVLLGKTYDARADQYALAVTVYQVLSGTLPFDGLTPAAIVMQQAAKTAVPLHERLPGLPKALAAVVQKGMRRDPRQRFPTCQVFADAALAAALGQPLSAKAVEPNGRPQAADAVTVPALMSCPRCHKKFGIPPTAQGQRVCCPFCKTVSRPPDDSQTTQPENKLAPHPQGNPARRNETPRKRRRSRAKVALWLFNLLILQGAAVGAWWVLAGPASQDAVLLSSAKAQQAVEKAPSPKQADPPEQLYRGGKTLAQWATALRDADAKIRQEAVAALVEADVAAVPVLITALKEKGAGVRATAASSLGQIGKSAEPAVPELLACLGDPDAPFREATVLAIGAICTKAKTWDAQRIEALGNFVRRSGENPRVRIAAAGSLAQLDPTPPAVLDSMASLLPQLIERATEKDGVLRRASVAALAKVVGSEHTEAVGPLVKALDDPDVDCKRNAALALGRIGKMAVNAVAGLLARLEDPNTGVREVAASSLGKICGPAHVFNPELLKALAVRLADDVDPSVRRGAAFALGSIGKHDDAVRNALAARLKDEDPTVRQKVAWALGRMGDKAAPSLKQALKDPDPLVRREAADALGLLGEDAAATALPELLACCGHSDLAERRAAYAALVGLVRPEALKDAKGVLLAGLKDADRLIRSNAALALAQVGGPAAAPAVGVLIETLRLKDTEPNGLALRRSAALAFGNIGPAAKDAVADLRTALHDPDEPVRHNAAVSCIGLREAAEPALPDLLKLLTTKNEADRVRAQAAVAISRIGYKPGVKTAMPVILQLVADSSEKAWVRERAIWPVALYLNNDENRAPAYKVLLGILAEPKAPQTKMLRYNTAYLLGMFQVGMAPEKVLDVLEEFLKDPEIKIYAGRRGGATGVTEKGGGTADSQEAGKGDGRIMVIDALTRIGAQRVNQRPAIVAQLRQLDREADPKTEFSKKIKKLLDDLKK